MIRNYFKTAWRNLWRNKGFALINILGLATGLTCCLLLTLYLQHELSYDHFHSKGDRIVRVIMEYKIGDSGNKGNFTSTKVFPEFRRQFPEVASGVRLSGTDRIVKYGDQTWEEQNVLHADSTFFEMFDFKLLSGTAPEVLKAPNQVVITRSLAEKYFGKEEAVGKTLLLNSSQQPYLVTGVSEDCPSNSQIRFSMVASISSFGPLQEETYSNANFVTYLLMDRAESLNALQEKINRLMQKENAEAGFKVNFDLEPFTRVHLYSPYDAYTPNINISYIYIIAGVALLILVIACFTYVNLSTARSTERAREVGIRVVDMALKNLCNATVLITQRLDRDVDGGRKPYLSARSLLLAEEGEEPDWMDLLAVMRRCSKFFGADARQLWLRLVFMRLINARVSLGKFGFVYRSLARWELAPATALRPGMEPDHQPVISGAPGLGLRWDVDQLLKQSVAFGIPQNEASTLLKRMVEVISRWKVAAVQYPVRMTNTDLASLEAAMENAQLREAREVVGGRRA